MASASTCCFPRSRKKVSSGAWPNPISSRCRERRRRFSPAAKFPYRSCEGTNATNGTLGVGVNYTPNVSIEWKQYGVGLDFTPTVLNNGIINLQLNPSVTEVNTANSLNINGTTVPSLTERRAHTAVELRDGQSFAIAGLLQAQSSNTINQLPWVGNLPILGALFRSTDFQKNQTDLVIIVSPHLVRPVRRDSISRRRSTRRFRPTTSTCS